MTKIPLKKAKKQKAKKATKQICGNEAEMLRYPHACIPLKKKTKNNWATFNSHDGQLIFSSNVTPNAQESEDSGLSLSYSVLGSEAAKRISSSSSSIGEQDQDKEYEEEAKVLRQKDRKNNGTGSGNYDFR